MKDYYVYILECADGSYYTGITSKLEERITQHEYGVFQNCYTYKRRPIKLVYTGEFHDVFNAIGFEKQLKGWSRKKKQALINGSQEELEILSKRRAGKPICHGEVLGNRNRATNHRTYQ